MRHPISLVRRRSNAYRAFALISAVAFGLAVIPGQAFAQSGDVKAQDKNQAPPPDVAKDNQRRVNEFAEAAQVLNGPSGNPECVWLGRRVVGLMWRDDLDTALRHLELYDRFGCPGGHIQAAFRCLVRFGGIDPKAPESLNGRIHACWINPQAKPDNQAAAAPATPDAQKK